MKKEDVNSLKDRTDCHFAEYYFILRLNYGYGLKFKEEE